MRLHTKLGYAEVYNALRVAKAKGRVTQDVSFAIDDSYGSRIAPQAFEIQLGTCDKNSLPEGYTDQNGHRLRVRRYKNSGSSGADSVYSATWHEWGWFMAEIFAADPEAVWGGKSWGYHGVTDFHEKTGYLFMEETV